MQFDEIEQFEEDVEAELLAEEYSTEQGHNKGAPPPKRRATAKTRSSNMETGAASEALHRAEAIVQAAVANGKSGMSRG